MRRQRVGLQGDADGLQVRLEDARLGLVRARVREDAGVVDQHIDATVLGAQVVPQRLDRCRRGHVQALEAYIEPLCRQALGSGAAFGVASGSQHHPIAALGELADGLEAEPAIGTGDDCGLGLAHGMLRMVDALRLRRVAAVGARWVQCRGQLLSAGLPDAPSASPQSAA
jgi:hypothetical protein